MSNFLQRIAATVIQPNAKLQPMLGSIFAPTTFYSPGEPFTPEIHSQTIASHPSALMSAPRVDASSRSFARNSFDTEDQLFPATANEDASPFRSNRSPVADQPLLPAFDSSHNRRGSVHPHPFAEDAAFESSKPAANQASSPTSYQPLIAASQSPPPRLHPLDSLSHPAAARTSGSEAARRFQAPQREADEIHIHIRRIEVAAIAQPVPRPAAAAARRSLNLDEYLRRGNGRPG